MEKANQSSVRKSRSYKSTVVTVLVALTVIAAAVYFLQPSVQTEAAEPALQTAKVRTGDLVITANGAGTVIPAAQVDLGFRSSGIVSKLNVAVGSEVIAGQVLVVLDGNVQAEADLDALFTPNGILQAEGDVAQAQVAVDDAETALEYLISPLVYYYEVKVAEAQSALDALKADASSTKEAITDAENNLQRMENNLKNAQTVYVEEYVPVTFTYSWVDAITRETVTSTVPPSDGDVILARANLESARVLLQDAQTALDIVKAGRASLTEPLAAFGPQVARIEQLRLEVESARLVAPFDGTITSLNVIEGQTVGTAPILSLATTQNLLVRFYLDETDVDKASTGRRVTFTFDAYPDLPVNGEILSVEPAMQTVDGTPVVVVWAKLTDETEARILSGMTVEVEVIAAEARDALLVPVQALRELAPGSYAVFVVQADGTLKMTPVTVGLRDYANAEILSGLKIGDVVSTGTVETK